MKSLTNSHALCWSARDYLIPLTAIKPMTRFLLLLLPLLANAFQLPTASLRMVSTPLATPTKPVHFVVMQEAAEEAPSEEPSAEAEDAETVVPAAKGYEESLLIASDGPDPIKTVGIFFVLAALLIAGRGGVEESGIAKEIAGIAGQ